VGSVGVPEIIVVLIVALVVLGPNRLPEAARQAGKALSEFKRVTAGLQAEVRDAIEPITSAAGSFNGQGTGPGGPDGMTVNPRPAPAAWVTPPLPVEGPDGDGH